MSDDGPPVSRNKERMLNNLSCSDLQEVIMNFERAMYPQVASRLNNEDHAGVIEMLHNNKRSIEELRSDMKKNMNIETVDEEEEEDDVPNSCVFWTVVCGERFMFHLPIESNSGLFSDLKIQSTDPLLDKVLLVSLMGTAQQTDLWHVHPDPDDAGVADQAKLYEFYIILPHYLVFLVRMAKRSNN